MKTDEIKIKIEMTITEWRQILSDCALKDYYEEANLRYFQEIKMLDDKIKNMIDVNKN